MKPLTKLFAITTGCEKGQDGFLRFSILK